MTRMDEVKEDSMLKAIVDGKTTAAVIAALVWAVLTVAGSPDRNTALIILSIIVVGISFAIYVVTYNKKQDGKLEACEKRERDAQTVAGSLRTAIAILHTRVSSIDRRKNFPIPPLHELIGQKHAEEALNEIRKFIIPPPPHQKYRRRKTDR